MTGGGLSEAERERREQRKYGTDSPHEPTDEFVVQAFAEGARSLWPDSRDPGWHFVFRKWLAARADATQQAGLTLSRAEAVDLHWLLAVAIHSGLPRGDMLNLAHGLSRRVADYTGGDTSTTDAWRRRTSAPAREADPQPDAARHDEVVRREVAERTWDEVAEALAWCLANGPADAAVEYVRAHNPYRADATSEGGDGRG